MKSFCFLIFIIMLTGCCKKDNKDVTYNLSEKEKLLTSHGWHKSGIKVNGVEANSEMPWDVDDCWVFREDGTFSYYYGSLRSNIHQQDLTGTWKLIDAEKKIAYATGGVPNAADPDIEITSDLMVLTFSDLSSGEKREITYIRC